MAALQAVMQSQAGADAMAYDGVRADPLVLLVEAELVGGHQRRAYGPCRAGAYRARLSIFRSCGSGGEAELRIPRGLASCLNSVSRRLIASDHKQPNKGEP